MAANADRTPHWIVLYFRKWNGMVGVKSRPPPALTETFFSMLAAFASMLVVAGVIRLSPITTSDQNLLLSSFGASAVLLYHEIDAPVTQPTNVLGGTLLSSVIGVSVARLIPRSLSSWLGGAVAVALSIGAMGLSNTMHPPAGAIALTAVIGSDYLKGLGFYFVLQPALFGTVVMLLCALLINNLHPVRRFPRSWFNVHAYQPSQERCDDVANDSAELQDSRSYSDFMPG
ncbi:HPP family protein [Plasmodiophora brassicae]|uniref:HPP transmembrane region domain-containing protein n=1 Tax=Plasmodiophora brassicae TaxID=37360 RepID=A0A0G4IKY7_PLABS|nr:hypothetical protein PBRA_004606 [Plasmodiophora brassicae]